MIAAFQVPVVMVPIVVKEEEVILVPRAPEERTGTPAISYEPLTRLMFCPEATLIPLLAVNRPDEVRVPAPVRLAPWAVNAVVPPGARVIFPVPRAPKVRLWLLVVPIAPLPVK
jgi:hypothetical protein